MNQIEFSVSYLVIRFEAQLYKFLNKGFDLDSITAVVRFLIHHIKLYTIGESMKYYADFPSFCYHLLVDNNHVIIFSSAAIGCYVNSSKQAFNYSVSTKS